MMALEVDQKKVPRSFGTGLKSTHIRIESTKDASDRDGA
jgi:hypothetical protein